MYFYDLRFICGCLCTNVILASVASGFHGKFRKAWFCWQAWDSRYHEFTLITLKAIFVCGRAQAGSALSAGSSTPTSASLFLSRGGKGGGQKRRSIRQNQPPWGPSHSQGCGFAYKLYGVVFDMFRTCCSNLLFLPWQRSLALWLDLVLASFSPLLLSSLPEREISLSREREKYI